MRPQLIERTIDHAHAHELTAVLGLPEHFERDKLDRLSRTHVLSVRRSELIVLESS